MGNVIVKDIKGILLFRFRLLKNLKAYNRKLPKNRKIYFNTTVTLKAYTPVTKTKGVRPYTVGLITCLKDLFVRFLILKGYIGKVI